MPHYGEDREDYNDENPFTSGGASSSGPSKTISGALDAILNTHDAGVKTKTEAFNKRRSNIWDELGGTREDLAEEYSLMARLNADQYAIKRRASKNMVQKDTEDAVERTYAQYVDAGLSSIESKKKAMEEGARVKTERNKAHHLLFPESDNVVSRSEQIRNGSYK